MKTMIVSILLILTMPVCLAATDPLDELRALSDYNQRKTTQTQLQQPQSATNPSDKMAYDFQVLKEKNKVEEVIALCTLAIISLIVVLYFLTKNKDDNTGVNIVNATGLIFIVVGTISLTIMAQTEQQLTAAIGILGAIAGYLFGSMKHKEISRTEEVRPPK